MQQMVTDNTRRNLLKAALLGAAVPVLPFGCVSRAENPSSALIGCSLKGRDKFSAVVADDQGNLIREVPLPGRGHGVAVNATARHAVAFARRPGTFMVVFDYDSGEVMKAVPAASNRHYYGHGVYSNDGQWLYVTEGERGTSRGIIGVYDVQARYTKVAEFTGFGLGPHEVIVMPDDAIVIGVGGVHTNGREPLNIATMTPSLSYLNTNGELIDQHALPDNHLSIRHLAHDGDKTVLCGQQYRGEPDEYPSLLAMHTRGGELIPLQAEPEEWSRFNHYIASIAATEEWILATSPRGNCYGIWSKRTQKLVELSSLSDASGVVARNGEFRVSSGVGSVVTQNSPNQKSMIRSDVQWDNHWSAIPS
ncbi:DUF1513 domain-containing protein [Vibrio japonicus]|uniref:DUF1513 domain-containing protein n=1 Tax=Vibrio japonicus TaxID=1824638 RepID=A0ABY5LL62_9VIBR|nr:DUF1513 domain-containing protein [Vibrio japonicus]UUM31641.1 DUF1513 domain-containing protein [Vibrio japonicus]